MKCIDVAIHDKLVDTVRLNPGSYVDSFCVLVVKLPLALLGVEEKSVTMLSGLESKGIVFEIKFTGLQYMCPRAFA